MQGHGDAGPTGMQAYGDAGLWRCVPMRCMPMEMHTYEIQAYEMQASKMQAFERYAREGDAPMRCNPLMRCTPS
jgi:hypothetical protein